MGEQRLSLKSKSNLEAFFQRTDIDWDNSMVEIKSPDMQIVEQAKSNALYNSVARRGGFNCTLDQQDLNQSFQKAMFVLQKKDRKQF